MPNAVNVPLLRKERELKAVLTTSDLQAAYGLTDEFGVMLNANFVKQENQGGIKNTISTSIVEGGLGYAYRNDEGIIVETYGLFGLVGANKNETIKILNSTKTQEKTIDLQGIRFCIQPSVGIAKKGYEIAFATRLSMLKYSTPQLKNYSSLELSELNITGIESETWPFLEPVITLRGGHKAVKVQLQLGKSFKLNSGAFNYRANILNFGIVVNIGAPKNPPTSIPSPSNQYSDSRMIGLSTRRPTRPTSSSTYQKFQSFASFYNSNIANESANSLTINKLRSQEDLSLNSKDVTTLPSTDIAIHDALTHDNDNTITIRHNIIPNKAATIKKNIQPTRLKTAQPITRPSKATSKNLTPKGSWPSVFGKMKP